MTDCFALLDQPRQPWIDPDQLKDRFNALSSTCHPDKVQSATDAERVAAVAHYTELSHAYQLLRDTKSRLGHLIELTTGAPPGTIQQVAPDSADLFFQVSALCRQVDAFLAEQGKATSPLVKAGFFARGLDWTDRLQHLQQSIAQQSAALENELRSTGSVPTVAADSASATARDQSVERLTEIYRQLSYFSRWTAQLQERIVQLSV